MTALQIGNEIGVISVDNDDAKLAEITADGVSSFTVALADVAKFSIFKPIVFRVKATGAGFGTTSRVVQYATDTGVVGYSGADIALVPGTHAVYDASVPYATSTTAKTGKTNINGGSGEQAGFSDYSFGSLENMRTELARLVPGTYTNAYLNKMTWNDMVYAIRAHKYPTSFR